MSEVFDLGPTYIKYLSLNLCLGPGDEEEMYIIKGAIRSINLSKECGY
jgi:hypothetical protein